MLIIIAIIIYGNKIDGSEHLALIKGEINTSEPVMVRMHHLNLFEDMLGDDRNNKNSVLQKSMQKIAKNKNVYYIDRFSWICNQNEKKCSILTKNNELMHLDGGHFTHEGIKDISEIVYEKKVFEFLKLNRY